MPKLMISHFLCTLSMSTNEHRFKRMEEYCTKDVWLYTVVPSVNGLTLLTHIFKKT